jgi:malonyl-CoA O-methyltransferase
MLDKEEIKVNFSRSAPDYDRYALLQKKLADDLFSSLAGTLPKTILDIGCGTGRLTQRLAQTFPRARVIGIDLAPGMIKVAQRKHRRGNLKFTPGDGENLFFGKQKFDLIISNCSLQWMDFEKVLAGVFKCISLRGQFLFNTFGPKTLLELRASGFKVNQFMPMGRLLERAKGKFEIRRADSKIIKQKFRSVKELIHHLKETGVNSADTRGSKNKNIFAAFKNYKSKYGSNGFVNASYEILNGLLLPKI